MKSIKTLAYLLCILLMIFGLSACKRQISKNYNYFLVHPEQIEPVYKRCEKLLMADAANDQECMAAIQAVQKVRPLVLEAAQYPLSFGQKLLTAQSMLVQQRQALIQANKQLLKLKQTAAKQDPINQQQAMVEKLQNMIIQQNNNIATMTGIIKLLRPIPQ